MVHADIHTRRARFFVELKSGLAFDRSGGPRPADEDKLDLNAAFLESARGNVRLRVGRKEIHYGDGGMLAIREGLNVRRAFDGAKVIVHHAGRQITRRVEPFYVYLRRKRARFDQGIGREERHTVAVHTIRDRGGLAYESSDYLHGETDRLLCGRRNDRLRCGARGGTRCPPCPPELIYPWGYEALRNIKTEIDAERPLIVTGPGHLYLIVGYVEKGDEFSIITQDEGGRKEVSLQQNSGETADWVDGHNVITQLDGNEAVSLQLLIDAYWTGLAPVKLGKDEQSISDDFDHDGVMDFDEEERFATKMRERDSDGDGVGDKEEIHYSVWDPDHGYHKTVGTFSAYAGEEEVAAKADNAYREAMELFLDSDNGGCDDGRENDNRDGKRSGAETSNFVMGDDVLDEQGKCAQLWIGTIHSTHKPAHSHLFTTTIQVRLREVDPKEPRRAVVGAIEWIDLFSAGSVVTRTHSSTGTDADCVISGHGSSPANSTNKVGQIYRTVESIGPGGEIRWSTPTYLLWLAPEREIPWTERCQQGSWTRGAGRADGAANIGDATAGASGDPQIRTLENGRMFGSYMHDDGTSASWSICRQGTECPPPPSPP